MPETPTNNLDNLIELMAKLRDPHTGCPWDVRQNFHTIAPYTIEEAYEVADAISRNDMTQLKGELGDLLFQVVFHSRMAEELGEFSISDVIKAIVSKMTRRHPHVFDSESGTDSEMLEASWESIKAAERRAEGETSDSIMDGVAIGLPGLIRALKLQKKAARVGFDWTSVSPVIEKLKEEISELEQALEQNNDHGQASVMAELGDVLFSVVNVARHLKLDSEACLSAANSRFEHRFRTMENLQRQQANDFASLSSTDLEQLWQAAKKRESNAQG